MTAGAATSTATTEVLFYQLDRHPLEKVLPGLLERSLERGWRAIVQTGGTERLEALDTLLWTYSEESFLPHGGPKEGPPAMQPVFLTTGEDNPNGAAIRFLVDGADVAVFDGYARVVYLFDGKDEEARTRARGQWKRAKGSGCEVTFWRQNERGVWQKQG
jgi:DNA polymerase-3 subunit chi